MLIKDNPDKIGQSGQNWTIWIPSTMDKLNFWTILNNLDLIGQFRYRTKMDILDKFGQFGPNLKNARDFELKDLAKWMV